MFVSAFDTPDHLWVQVISKESVRLDEMTKDMTQYYASLKQEEHRLESGN